MGKRLFNRDTQNMEKKIDITSTVLETGIDAARNYLDKLIMLAVEETGLLLKDNVPI